MNYGGYNENLCNNYSYGSYTASNDRGINCYDYQSDYYIKERSPSPTNMRGNRSVELLSDYIPIGSGIRSISASVEPFHQKASGSKSNGGPAHWNYTSSSPAETRVPTLRSSVDREASSSPDSNKGITSFFTSCFSCFKKDN